MDIQNFIDEFKQTFVYDMLSQTLTDDQIFDHFVGKNGEIIWSREQMRQIWKFAKSQAMPDGFVLIAKEPAQKFKDNLENLLFSLWIGDHGCDWDGFVNVNAIDPDEVWQLAIESQEPAHD